MQHEILKIIDQLDRFYSGNNWAEVPSGALIAGITEAQANTKAPFASNTIHQLVRHVLATEAVVTDRLKGMERHLSADENFIPQQAILLLPWNTIRDTIDTSRKALTAQLLTMDDDAMDRPVIPGSASVYATLHGHIQHAMYHYGQVSMIRKWLLETME